VYVIYPRLGNIVIGHQFLQMIIITTSPKTQNSPHSFPSALNTGMINFNALFFFFQAEDGIRDFHVTGVQTCALPISAPRGRSAPGWSPARSTWRRSPPWADRGRPSAAGRESLRRPPAAGR